MTAADLSSRIRCNCSPISDTPTKPRTSLLAAFQSLAGWAVHVPVSGSEWCHLRSRHQLFSSLPGTPDQRSAGSFRAFARRKPGWPDHPASGSAGDLAGQNAVGFGNLNHAFRLAGFVVDGFPFANRRIAGRPWPGADTGQNQRLTAPLIRVLTFMLYFSVVSN